MRTLSMSAAVLALGLSAGTATAGGCLKADEIAAAFEPRFDYEHERAIGLSGPAGDWPADIRDGFAEIGESGLDCHSLYARYTGFMEHVIARNDMLAGGGKAVQLFRKW